MRHSVLLALAIFFAGFILHTTVAQNSPPAETAPPGTPLTSQQLDNLVAPIALYPDPLLSEVFAAATYPIEIAEAEQWVRDHPKWKPSKLMDEAKKQHWDPSVQGLVAFPDVLTRLSQDIGWTTQLGNAFLAQQADVMQAVQRMRAQRSGERDPEVHTAGNSEYAKPEWAKRHHHRARQPGYLVRAELQSRLCLGTAGLGLLSADLLSWHRRRFWIFPGHRSRTLLRWLGRLGMGRLGLGTGLVRRRPSSSIIPSSIATASSISMENRWDVPCGRIIRNTGSACRTPIAV